LKCGGGYAPGGAAACGIEPATWPPEGLPRCLQLKRRSELRFFMHPIAGAEIAAVGRADLRHVIIVLPPASSPPPRAMSHAFRVLRFVVLLRRR